ncbi:hypothetical protein LOTGIDRAFT_159484 [Lottia gigantea]|uniref:Uncharacterized protein n=1 Tax=Lottia gigantea TaxID=225164 RepID=V4AUK3_LOTGI|nr:hypothetical protein LOTGIDRAFT_159484 [Lottia gigantea]ESO97451.1 hypothetical protein LOTGIDRAFT_159484 [Lottia gigantea]
MTQVEVRTCRPIKHLAVLFSIFALILIIVALAGSNWVDVKLRDDESYQNWGLWEECFEIVGFDPICVSKDWMSACGAFVIITLLASVGAIVLGIFGICTKTRTWYIIAGILCVAGALCDLIALIVYPSKFSEEIQGSSVRGWDFDWTYGISWGALFFLVGGAVLFFWKVDDEEENFERAPKHFYDNRMT